MKRYNIAIVDDHQVVIDGLIGMLVDNDQIHVCKTFSTTHQLIPALHTISVDMLLLDVEVQEVNTFSLIPILKTTFPQIKIITFTSYDTIVFRKKAAKLGIDAFLVKTANKEQLLKTIYKVLQIELCTKASSPLLAQQILSTRELEILILVAQGNTSQQIANQLFLSKHTVQWHRKNILRKLGLTSMSEMIKLAFEQQLI